MKNSDVITPKRNDKFTREWWSLFIEKTRSLKKTTVFEHCLNRDETLLMRNYLMDIIAQLSQMRTGQFGYRVFVDGQQVDQKEMETIYDKEPFAGESFEDWAARSFEDVKFGMIINRGEKFSPDLAEMVSKKIAPLLEKIGIPRLGITFTIFIGNYGWTPIGIHTDAIGEKVLHFHLGKGRKTMYTWDRESYEEKTTPLERINNTEIEKHLEYANEYDFGEGDLYFMAEGEYHVGRSDELSMGLTLWFNNHTKNQLSRRALQVVTDQYLQDNSDILFPDLNSVSYFEGFKESLDLFNIPEELENMTFKEVLQEAYKDFRYSLYSNGGFWTRPFPVEQNFQFTNDIIVKKVSTSNILYKESVDGKKLYIYVRGTKLIFNNYACIKNMIDELNKGNDISVEKLMKMLDESWDESIGFYILNAIYLHQGIRILNEHTQKV